MIERFDLMDDGLEAAPAGHWVRFSHHEQALATERSKVVGEIGKAREHIEQGLAALADAFGDEDPSELPGSWHFRKALDLLEAPDA